MEIITWEEFKAMVDKELNGKNPKILYIDTGTYPEEKYLDVMIDDNGDMLIS